MLCQLVPEWASPILASFILSTGDHDPVATITRVDKYTQNARIENLTNQLGELCVMLLSAPGPNNRRATKAILGRSEASHSRK